DRQNQVAYSKGVMGTHTVARVDNTILWVGTDPEAGGVVVYRLGGGPPPRLSSHAGEAAPFAGGHWCPAALLASFLNGHAFFHVILPDAPSWVYDCATQLWHEQSTFGLTRWRGNCHVSAYGRQIVGSCNSGDLFELSDTYRYDGDSTLIEAEMVSAPI